MRHLLVTCLTLVFAVTIPWSADPPKDSPTVASTRKKLLTKVTVDYKETPLREVIDDLKQQVENLSFTKPESSLNQPITFKATEMPLKDALDGMFKKNQLGYVISKKKDRYEGWIIIKPGTARGDEETPEEPKGADKTPAKGKDKPPPKEKPDPKDKPEVDAAKVEQDANRKLDFAKTLAKDGKTAKAKERLEEIVAKYPKTKAAGEAKELLKTLDK